MLYRSKLKYLSSIMTLIVLFPVILDVITKIINLYGNVLYIGKYEGKYFLFSNSLIDFSVILLTIQMYLKFDNYARYLR